MTQNKIIFCPKNVVTDHRKTGARSRTRKPRIYVTLYQSKLLDIITASILVAANYLKVYILTFGLANK